MDRTEILSRLLLASILGAFIGLERETGRKPAGLKTHTLVSLGSCLIMLISLEGAKFGSDPFRLAAQVISGIGFLGAGTIMHRKEGIDGLTTAATLWVSAGIGLAVGYGLYFAAIVTVLIVLLLLRLVLIYEKRKYKDRWRDDID